MSSDGSKTPPTQVQVLPPSVPTPASPVPCASDASSVGSAGAVSQSEGDPVHPTQASQWGALASVAGEAAVRRLRVPVWRLLAAQHTAGSTGKAATALQELYAGQVAAVEEAADGAAAVATAETGAAGAASEDLQLNARVCMNAAVEATKDLWDKMLDAEVKHLRTQRAAASAARDSDATSQLTASIASNRATALAVEAGRFPRLRDAEDDVESVAASSVCSGAGAARRSKRGRTTPERYVDVENTMAVTKKFMSMCQLSEEEVLDALHGSSSDEGGRDDSGSDDDAPFQPSSSDEEEVGGSSDDDSSDGGDGDVSDEDGEGLVEDIVTDDDDESDEEGDGDDGASVAPSVVL